MISRRAVVVGAIGLSLGGAIGSGAFLTNRAEPAIRVIGDRDGMLVMIETKLERLLLLTGDVEEWLWTQRANLTTIGRSRVDLLVGTYQTLFDAGVKNLPIQPDTVVLSLQRDASLPPLRGNITAITDHLEMRIGNDATLTIEVMATLENDAHPDFVATYRAEKTTSVIASRSVVIPRSPLTGVNALIVPGEIDAHALAAVNPAVLVTTVTDGPRGAWTTVPVYTDRPATLTLDDGAIQIDANQVLS